MVRGPAVSKCVPHVCLLGHGNASLMQSVKFIAAAGPAQPLHVCATHARANVAMFSHIDVHYACCSNTMCAVSAGHSRGRRMYV